MSSHVRFDRTDPLTSAGVVCLFLAALLSAPAGIAGWGKWLKPLNPLQLLGKKAAVGDLSRADIAEALRQALVQASQTAVQELGGKNGFTGNPKLAVPMPPALSKIEGVLRKAGQGQVVDQFKKTLNTAAAESVQEATPVFTDVIKKMTLADVERILSDGGDAATRYLKENAGAELRKRMIPVVRKATAQSGLAGAYKLLVEKLGFARNFLSGTNMDLDSYVTDRTLSALFDAMAVQEKKIRENPAAQTTALLKKVFGAASGLAAPPAGK